MKPPRHDGRSVPLLLLLLLPIALLIGYLAWLKARESDEASATISITSAPQAEAGTMATRPLQGWVNAKTPQKYKVVIYTLGGDIWWVQPFTTAPLTDIQPDGHWERETHGGTAYAVLLVNASYEPEPKVSLLPKPGGKVLAVTTVVPEGVVPGAHGDRKRISINHVPSAVPTVMATTPLKGIAYVEDPAQYRVVVYARWEEGWWLQPFAWSDTINIRPDGQWETQTHGGTEFAALVVRAGYKPAPMVDVIPKLGGDVLASTFERPIPLTDRVWFKLSLAGACLLLGLLSLALVFALKALVRSNKSLREDIQRREQAEVAVASRSAELQESNAKLNELIHEAARREQALQHSEEKARQLNLELEARVLERTQELKRANDQLAQSNRELESFSFSISHDLRAPLRNINGFAELLSRKVTGRLADDERRYLDTVILESRRLSGLIQSLLNFSRLNFSTVQFEQVRLDELVSAIIDQARASEPERPVEWRTGALPPVNGDAALLRQVIENLILNALKFTRGRNPAVIEIRLEPVCAEHPQEQVVHIADNGVGFDPKYVDKLFGVFQRLHGTNDFEGTGIGLANVRRIIQRHGGRVWATGEPNKGATFSFSLPVQH
jgi:signal transduction histidine kinase